MSTLKVTVRSDTRETTYKVENWGIEDDWDRIFDQASDEARQIVSNAVAQIAALAARKRALAQTKAAAVAGVRS